MANPIKNAINKTWEERKTWWDFFGGLPLLLNYNKPLYGGGQLGGAGAGSLFILPTPEYELVKDTLWVPVLESYNEAFANARKKGLKTFMFNGELKNTELGNDPKALEAGSKRFLNVGLIPIERTKKIIPKKDNSVKKHQGGGPVEPSAYNRAVYSSINPLWGIPDNFFLAARLATQAKIKSMGDNPDKMDYEVGNSLGAKVADAGWRKRLGLEYEDLYLPVFNGDTVRLPRKLEMEIPTDTTMLKNRIAATEKLMKRSSKYENSDAINLALKSDKRALEALRKTYATGLPVGIDEFSHNSRQLVKNGEIDEEFITPLNVFRNYNIRYDKPTNRMYYSKSYDFDTVEHDWDKFVPGNPFYIRGYVDLNKKK